MFGLCNIPYRERRINAIERGIVEIANRYIGKQEIDLPEADLGICVRYLKQLSDMQDRIEEEDTIDYRNIWRVGNLWNGIGRFMSRFSNTGVTLANGLIVHDSDQYLRLGKPVLMALPNSKHQIEKRRFPLKTTISL